MKISHVVWLALLTVAVSACTPLSRSGEQPLSPEEIRLNAIEGKLAEVSRRLSGVENKDETRLRDDLSSLRGDIERMRFDLESLSRQRKDLNGDIERRLQRLEAQPGAPLGAATAPTLEAIAPPVPPVVYAPSNEAGPVNGTNAATAAEEQTAYLKAFDFLKAGKYDSAIAGFRGMLDKWPQGNFADNAWYWLGESQYVKRQYKPALDSYTALIQRFPTSPKVPDALFKSGLTQVELGQVDQAKANWRRVMKDYPNANAAGLARQRLTQTP